MQPRRRRRLDLSQFLELFFEAAKPPGRQASNKESGLKNRICVQHFIRNFSEGSTMRATVLWMAVAVSLCQAAVNPLDQESLKLYLQNGAPFDFILIDVRTSEEAATAIGNAACKPYNLAWPAQFKSEVVRIPKDMAIIVYCRSGGRSRLASTYLEENGYTRVYDAGGFNKWDGPTVPASEIKAASSLPAPSMLAKP
jgi:rhodanese-related sulfurtransferase